MAKLLRKVYSRIFWKNEDESKATPLGKSNLNKEDEALEIIDQRVCDLSNDKAEVSEVQDSIIYYDIEPISGNITVRTRGGGEKIFYIYQLIPRLAAVKAEADRAEHMADVATEYGNKAIASANAAAISEANSKVSETNAKTSEVNAKNSEDLVVPVKPIAEEAIAAAENIRDVEANVEAMVDKLLDEITGTFVGALTAKGTIPFESLPTTDIQLGEMYNISNNFVSDARFADGAGIEYKAGSNVYWTMDGKWDVLAAPASAKVLESTGIKTMISGATNPSNAGLVMEQAYNSGWPVAYGNVISLLGNSNGGSSQLLLQWTADTTPGRVLYRSKRDYPVNAPWTDWVTLLDTRGGQRVTGWLGLPYLTLWDGVRSRDCIFIYDDGDGATDYGSEMVIGANGNTFIGGGEAATDLRNALINGNPLHTLDYSRIGENVFIAADGRIYLISGYQFGIASNMASVFVSNDGVGCTPEHRIPIGYSNCKWTNVWTDKINNIGVDTLAATGSGTPYGKFVWVSSNGDTEIGRYLDFHASNSDMDYSARMEVMDSGGTIELHSGGRNQSSDNPRFRIVGNTTARSSDFWLVNNATGQQIALSLSGNGSMRGLWDAGNLQYWCYIDSANKAWFKGTADMAIADLYGSEFQDIFTWHQPMVYLSGAASQEIILRQYEAPNGSSFRWGRSYNWLLFIYAYTTSSGDIYGRACKMIGGCGRNFDGESNNANLQPTMQNLYASSNSGFNVTGLLKNSQPRIIITGSSNRTVIAQLVEI